MTQSDAWDKINRVLNGNDTREDTVALTFLVIESLREGKSVASLLGARRKRSESMDYGPHIHFDVSALRTVAITHQKRTTAIDCIDTARQFGTPQALATVATGLRLFALISQEEAVEVLQEALETMNAPLGRNKTREKLAGMMESLALHIEALPPNLTGFADLETAD